MGNKKKRKSFFLLKLFKEHDDLCLDRNIQRCDRFICNDKTRFHEKASSYGNSLSLSAGKLSRLFRQNAFIQSCLLQDFPKPVLQHFSVTDPAADLYRLQHDLPYAHSWIQCSARILKDHLDLSLHFLPHSERILFIRYSFSLIKDLPACRPVDSCKRSGCRGFPAAGLSHQCHDLTFPDTEGNIIHCMDRIIGTDTEMLLQISGFDQYRGLFLFCFL